MRHQLKRAAGRLVQAVEVAARTATRQQQVFNAFDRAATFIDRALAPQTGSADFYGAAYFSGAGNPEDGKRSGYASYTRASSNADALAWVLAHHLALSRVLDVGCARGFIVEALRDLGCDARGCDFSEYAINTAARGARGCLRWADLSKRLPYEDKSFEVVTCFETLEHLPPEMAVISIGELARVSGGYVIATIPSFGPRPPLPSGWFSGKVKTERQPSLEALGEDFDGPIAAEDLARDSRGEPLEGHLTIASFRWWRDLFKRAGLLHCPDIEVAMYRELEQFHLEGFLDFYVFRRPETAVSAPSESQKARAREVLKPVTALRRA